MDIVGKFYHPFDKDKDFDLWEWQLLLSVYNSWCNLVFERLN